MRWTKEIPPRIQLGDQRKITYFAWWPVTLLCKRAGKTGIETRWLETVTVFQTYMCDDFTYFWHSDLFVDEPE